MNKNMHLSRPAQWILCIFLGIPPTAVASSSIWLNEPTFEGRITLQIWAAIGYGIVTATMFAIARPWSEEARP